MKKRELLLMVLVLSALLLFSACAAADESFGPMPVPEAPAPAMPEAAPPAADMIVAEEAEFDASPAEAAPPPAMAPPATGVDDSDDFLIPILTPEDAPDRILVYSVNMTLQTTDFSLGKVMLNNSVAAAGGYLTRLEIQGYDMQDPDAERRAHFQFRLPTAELPGFIVLIEQNFNIWSLHQEMWDNTQWYQQGTWTLENLREQESLLEERLENAEEEERDEIQAQLEEVRRSIWEWEMTQATIADAVAYSTIDIQLFEATLPEDYVPEPAPRFGPFELAFLILVVFVFIVILLIVVIIAKTRTPKNKESDEK